MRASGWGLVTPAASAPLAVTELKEHLRLSAADEDLLVADYLAAATDWAEAYTGRAFITQTWDVHFTGFPCDDRGFEIPLPPLQGVTSIKYTPAGGVEQTLAGSVYTAATAFEPGRVLLAHGQSWPTDTLAAGLPVVVRVVCGFGAASAVPATIKQGLRWIVGHMMENREAVTMASLMPQQVPMTARWALDPHRIRYVW